MKKGVIIAGIVTIAAIGILFSNYANEAAITASNLDVERKHGQVDTSMGSPIMGSISAPITIVEFGDYQCPNCASWFANVKPEIEENYIKTGTANLVFVDLIVFGPDSQKASEASYCAEEQGMYWEYHDILYSNQGLSDGGWANLENLKIFALQLDLDTELFDSCLDSDKYQNRVHKNTQIAIENGATGTPTFIIVNSDGAQQKIGGPQPFLTFKNVIDSML